MCGMTQLPQLVDTDPKDFTGSPLDARGTMGDAIDERIQASAMAEHTVHKRRHQAAIATIEPALGQLLGEDPVGKTATLLDLAKYPDRDLAS